MSAWQMNLIFSLLVFGAFVNSHAQALPDFDQLWNYSKPAETEMKFRELLPVAHASGDQDFLLQLMTQISRTQGLQRKFDDAHQTLDEVEAALSVKTPVAEIRFFLERGRVFNSSKKADRALALFIKAYELSVNRDHDRFAVDAAHMLAIAEPTTEKQIEWNLKALAIAESSPDDRARNWLGSLYNNLGWTYHDAGQFEEALSYFEKGLAFRESKGEASSIRIAKWAVARVYRSLKRYNEALEIQLRLKKEFESISEKDGFVFEELGEIYLALGRPTLAQEHFALAYDVLSQDEWFKANEAKRLARIKELGKV